VHTWRRRRKKKKKSWSVGGVHCGEVNGPRMETTSVGWVSYFKSIISQFHTAQNSKNL
jgi:hypothetical protein